MALSKLDTICAPATLLGSGAITLIRISGEASLKVIDEVVSFRKSCACETKGGRIKFGEIYSDGTLLDEVLVSIFRAPHSYTGEDSAEIACHASAYIAGEILRLLMEKGCRMAMPGEFTQRAFLNGKMDLTQAEAVADVISSTTAASHRIAMNQLKGGFSAELAQLRAQLLKMASLMELELDFSEEDVEFADRSALAQLLDATLERIDRLASSFKLGNAIKNGVPVAILGATNAGKSTLLNTILGEQRAIVSDIEGTTRDTIEECLNVDGVLFRFVDTAGIRADRSDSIEAIGMERSFAAAKKAEIVIVLIDAPALLKEQNYSLKTEECSGISQSLSSIIQALDFQQQKVIFALNKTDEFDGFEAGNEAKGRKTDCNNYVIAKNIIVSLINNKGIKFESGPEGESCLETDPEVINISAKSGSGVSQLLKRLSDMEKNKLYNAAESSVLVTNLRHYQTLLSAAENLRAVRSGMALDSNGRSTSRSLSTELLAEDLRTALSTLGSLTGEISHTDVLENIFRNFCIGK